MKKFKWLGVIAVALIVSWVGVSSVYATVAMGKKTGKGCTHCHTKAGSAELNEVGKKYKETGSL